MRHPSEDLAAFQNGERALVFARYKANPDGPLFHIEDGTARELRLWAKAELECFMPECADRRLTTVARSTKRDGFSHYCGFGGHKLESLFHQQAKALIVSWVQKRYPAADARMEVATAGRERIADVMLTGRDGRRVAVEIQYSPLTTDAWQVRHESYKAQGIIDVWLFGHYGKQMQPGYLRGHVELSVLHQWLLSAGLPLFWINPITAQIGTAGPSGRVGVDALTDCDITPNGLFTPAQEWLRPLEAEFAVREQAARERHEEEQLALLKQQAALTASTARFNDWVQRAIAGHRAPNYRRAR
jgi:hypothetical protein